MISDRFDETKAYDKIIIENHSKMNCYGRRTS